jgi:hypothetical protein
MHIASIVRKISLAAVCVTGLAWAAPSHAAGTVKLQAPVAQSQPAVTLAHWEYRHHRRYWVEDRHRYRRYDRGHDRRYEGRH